MASTPDDDNVMVDYYEWMKDNHIPKFRTRHVVFVKFSMMTLFPAALVTSLTLIVMFLRDKKMRKEPWRWLIAHTCLCIFLASTFFILTNGLISAEDLQSFEASILCPGTKFLERVFWQMSTLSFTLVLVERYRATRSDDWKSGGIGKKGVVISLAVFWFIAIVIHTVDMTINKDTLKLYEVYNRQSCEIYETYFSLVTKSIVLLWVLICAIVTLNGFRVYNHRTSSADLRNNVICPTVITTVFYLLFYVSFAVIEMIMVGFVYTHELFGKLDLSIIGIPISWIAFSLIWIIAWTKNRDIHWGKLNPCCRHATEAI